MCFGHKFFVRGFFLKLCEIYFFPYDFPYARNYDVEEEARRGSSAEYNKDVQHKLT